MPSQAVRSSLETPQEITDIRSETIWLGIRVTVPGAKSRQAVFEVAAFC